MIHYKWSFGNWWSFDPPIHGSGWQLDVQWSGGNFFRRAFAYKTSKEGVLFFNLTPKQGDYILSGRFEVFFNNDIRQSIVIDLNGHPVTYRWASGNEFVSTINSSVLKRGENEIVFYSK